MKRAIVVIVLAIAAGLFALALLVSPKKARAESLSAWFKNLRQPGTGVSCCDESDCRITEARMGPDGRWRARQGDSWLLVLPDRVLVDQGHPAGAAVLCATPAGYVYCFVPPGAGG